LLHGDSTSVTNKNAKQSVHLALRYLHAYCARFDEVPEADLTTAVDAIEDCVAASRLQTTSEPLYVTKLLTNCMSKAARMVQDNFYCLLSTFLHSCINYSICKLCSYNVFINET